MYGTTDHEKFADALASAGNEYEWCSALLAHVRTLNRRLNDGQIYVANTGNSKVTRTVTLSVTFTYDDSHGSDATWTTDPRDACEDNIQYAMVDIDDPRGPLEILGTILRYHGGAASDAITKLEVLDSIVAVDFPEWEDSFQA